MDLKPLIIATRRQTDLGSVQQHIGGIVERYILPLQLSDVVVSVHVQTCKLTMRLLWVQQWTVLPVIVEDGAMGDENFQQSGSGGLPLGGQAVDPPARNRLSEREGPSPARTTLPSFHLSSLYSKKPHQYIQIDLLSRQQIMSVLVIIHMAFICREPLPSSTFLVANHSMRLVNRVAVISWVEDSLQALSACLAWLERCPITSLQHNRKCPSTINSAS